LCVYHTYLCFWRAILVHLLAPRGVCFSYDTMACLIFPALIMFLIPSLWNYSRLFQLSRFISYHSSVFQMFVPHRSAGGRPLHHYRFTHIRRAGGRQSRKWQCVLVLGQPLGGRVRKGRTSSRRIAPTTQSQRGRPRGAGWEDGVMGRRTSCGVLFLLSFSEKKKTKVGKQTGHSLPRGQTAARGREKSVLRTTTCYDDDDGRGFPSRRGEGGHGSGSSVITHPEVKKGWE
jgi:hypothetical protein